MYALNLLFDAVNETFYSVVNGKHKKNKRKYNLKYKPGFFTFLHTFGRRLIFNPHVHVIFVELLLYFNGFYVNNKLEDDGIKFDSIKVLLKYVTRYCSRPAMVESRILDYDDKNIT